MKKQIATICLMILLVTGLHADTAKDFTLKKNPKADVGFTLLQGSACILADVDTILTYRGVSRWGLSYEQNPFWRNKLDKPALVFVLDMVIKTGIICATSKLYKKNKFLAYCVLIGINVVYGLVVYNHCRIWKRHT